MTTENNEEYMIDPEEIEYILFEMFGVDNEDDYEDAIECWNFD